MLSIAGERIMTTRVTIDWTSSLPGSLRREVLQVSLDDDRSTYRVEQMNEGYWQITVWEDQNWIASQQIFEKTIEIDGKAVEVAGLSAPIIKPEWDNLGYGTRAFIASMAFIYKQFTCDYVMIIRADTRSKMLEDCGWKVVSEPVTCWQSGASYQLSDDFCTLVFSLNGKAWPAGDIDLGGLPW